jgi:ribulose-phosphate 3-epimerase
VDFWHTLPADRLLADLSLWSADLTTLRTEIARTEPFADLYHLDVADAHFVPSLLFFPDLVAALRPLTNKPFHVHLMVNDPLALIEPFVDAGADLVTIHVEHPRGATQVGVALAAIRASGARAGLALQLETPLAAVQPYLEQVSAVVLLGTRLGVKGQDLAPAACPRIAQLRAWLEERQLADRVKIWADGGIRSHTVPALRAAGADAIVPGSLVFNSPDLAQTFAWLHEL